DRPVQHQCTSSQEHAWYTRGPAIAQGRLARMDVQFRSEVDVQLGPPQPRPPEMDVQFRDEVDVQFRAKWMSSRWMSNSGSARPGSGGEDGLDFQQQFAAADVGTHAQDLAVRVQPLQVLDGGLRQRVIA